MSFLKRLFGKGADPAMADTPEFLQFLEASKEELGLKTQAHNLAWHFGEEKQWGLNQDEGILRLTFADGIVAEAPAQAIGSFDPHARSWMWAWANPSISESLRKDVPRVREYGQQHGYERLATDSWRGTADDAWGMAAVAAKVCRMQGVYCGRAGATMVFLMFGQVKLSKAGAG